jgi:hypothetical protein
MEYEDIHIEDWPFTVKKVEEPARVGDPMHRCQCLLVCTRETGAKEDVHCRQMVIGPDIPFCDQCEGRHPEYATSTEVEVTVWGLQRGENT